MYSHSDVEERDLGPPMTPLYTPFSLWILFVISFVILGFGFSWFFGFWLLVFGFFNF